MGIFLGETNAADPSPWAMLPFAALLLAIALGPFLNHAGWERHYRKIALGLGLLSVGYSVFGLGDGAGVMHTAAEYLGFVILIGALFIVAGGIHIAVRLEKVTPLGNVLFLAIGGLLANLIGTTGASMLLIRPWIEINRSRIAPFHIVFFIFIVGNVGGCLTPIGDPPLFLGYLKQIPFFWPLAELKGAWALGMGLLLGIFYGLDVLHHRRLPFPATTPATASEGELWKIQGKVNFLFLAAILGAVFLPEPWRELVMVAAAAASLRWTATEVRAANRFTLAPMEEVAWLFAGIFATMIPALDFIRHHAGALQVDTPGKFYWITGGLSAVLDNAPTYLTFLTACLGLHGRSIDLPADMTAELLEHSRFIAGISLGAVFFGAMTYIGNGPNFMVKTIAQEAGVPAPHFFGYLFKYAVPFLLPVLFAVYWVFLRENPGKALTAYL